MTREQIFEDVKKIIVDILNVPEKDITEDKTLHDLKADSLDSVEVMMQIEKHYNIAITDHEMEKFTNVHSILDYLETNLNK